MDEQPLVIPTYKRVWKIERYLYKIDRFKLFRPVTYWQIAYFVLGLILIHTVNQMTGLFNFIPSLVRYLILPGAISWYLSKAKHDGKAPHRWIYTYIRYLFSPKVFNRYQPIVLQKKHSYSGSSTFRELYERDIESSVTPGTTTLQVEEG